MKIRMKPSEIRWQPDRFPPKRPCVVRCPLGELAGSLALPLMLLGIKSDRITTGPIVTTDRFNAQGLEGAAEIRTTWVEAFVLLARTDDHRAVVLADDAASPPNGE